MLTSKRLTASLLALSASALLGACGDDDGGNNPDARPVDGSTVDAAPGPDAAVKTRSATLAVTEVTVSTPVPPTQTIGGAAISISFEDQLTGGVAPAFDTGQIGGCQVFRYAATGDPQPHPAVSEGTVTLGGAGIVKPIGPCNFIQDAGYACITDNGTGAAGTATAVGAQSAVTVSITGKTFDAAAVRGQWLQISGVPAGAAPDATPTPGNGDVYNGTFPILNATGSTLTVANSAAVRAESVDFTAASFALVQGAGPIPTGGVAGPGKVDFLSDDPTKPVTVTLAAGASTNYPAGITASLAPIGAGLTLVEAPATDTVPAKISPEDFPYSDDNDIVIACEGAGCGSAPPAGALSGLIVSGRTTDTAGSPLAPFLMPDPTTSYATFTCTALGSTSVTIPKGALEKILEGSPKRIETRVLRVTFAPITAGQNTANVVVGHGIVGHSSAPPPAVR
jgi:hypothetical protein